jgi:hypothetical protein
VRRASSSARSTITSFPYGRLRMARSTPPTWCAENVSRRCGQGATFRRVLRSSTSASSRSGRAPQIVALSDDILRMAGRDNRDRSDSVASAQAFTFGSTRLCTFRKRSYACEFPPTVSARLSSLPLTGFWGRTLDGLQPGQAEPRILVQQAASISAGNVAPSVRVPRHQTLGRQGALPRP